VVFKLSCKLLGIPWPSRFQQREGALRRLSSNQYACLFGALSWGFAAFASSVADNTVTMHPVLAQLLKDWRAETPYALEADYVFASAKLKGRKPRLGSMVVQDYLQPAAIRAGILEVKDGKRYIETELVERFGFHTFRHSLTSWLMANGENPQIVRAMLRWANLNMLAHYAHGFKSDKLEAQGAVLNKRMKSGVKSGVGND
jgi:integrase